MHALSDREGVSAVPGLCEDDTGEKSRRCRIFEESGN